MDTYGDCLEILDAGRVSPFSVPCVKAKTAPQTNNAFGDSYLFAF